MSQRLEQHLISSGLVPADKINAARKRLADDGGAFDTALLEESAIPEAALLQALAQLTGQHPVNLAAFQPNTKASRLMPLKMALQLNCVPLSFDDHRLHVACTYPVPQAQFKDAEIQLGYSIALWIALECRVRDWQTILYGNNLPYRYARLLATLDPSRSMPKLSSQVDVEIEPIGEEIIDQIARGIVDEPVLLLKLKSLPPQPAPTVVEEETLTTAKEQHPAVPVEEETLTIAKEERAGGVEEGEAAGVEEGGAAGVEEGEAAGVEEGGAAGVEEEEAAGVEEGGAAGVEEEEAAGVEEGEAAGVEEEEAAGVEEGGAAGVEEEEAAGVEAEAAAGVEAEEAAGVEAEEAAGVEAEAAAGVEEGRAAGIGEKRLAGVEEGGAAGVEEERLAGIEEGGAAGVEEERTAGVEEERTAGVEAGEAAGVEDEKAAGVEDETNMLIEDAGTAALHSKAKAVEAEHGKPATTATQEGVSTQVTNQTEAVSSSTVTASSNQVDPDEANFSEMGEFIRNSIQQSQTPPATVQTPQAMSQRSSGGSHAGVNRPSEFSLQKLLLQLQMSNPAEWELEEARDALKKVNRDRDALVAIILEYGRRTFEYVAAFAIMRGSAVGWEARSTDEAASIHEVTIPLDTSSVFQTVAFTRGNYIGPLFQDELSQYYLSLFGRVPRTVFLWSIEVQSKLVAIIYGDCGTHPISQRRLSDFILFAQDLPAAFHELILFRKQNPKVAQTLIDRLPESTTRAVQSSPEPYGAHWFPCLFAQLIGPNPSERSAAMFELMKMPDEAAQALAAVFPGPSAWTRCEVTELPECDELGPVPGALARLGQAGAKALLPLLDAEHTDIRYIALLTAGSLLYPEVVDGVLRGLFDGNSHIASAARVSMVALSYLPYLRERLPALRKELSSNDPHRAALAARALGKLHDRISIGALIELTDNRDEACTQAATAALREITRASFSTDTAAWFSWWVSAMNKRRIEWLVDALDADEFALRLEAIEELSRFFQDNLGFFADGPLAERTSAVERWKSMVHSRPRLEL